MNKISTLTSKLNLLGDYTVQISENAMIAVSKSRDEVACYSIKGEEVLCKIYDRLVPSDYSLLSETNYIVGIKGSNSDILDTNLVILSKYYDEEIEDIIDNQYVIVFRPLSSTYRLTTIEGKELTTGVLFNIGIKKTPEQIVCICHQAVGDKSYILRLQNGSILSTLEIKNINKIYIGYEVIALQNSDWHIEIYDKLNKLKMVVKNGKVQQETVNGKSIYRVFDRYEYLITAFKCAKTLY